MIRIGHGYDAHRFSGDPSESNASAIVIGGVQIPHSHELLAHSDGDVLVHALCDALLGALALGDIGKHFPDTESEFENIDSRILLRKVMQEVIKANYKIANADMTIIAQTPKMAAHIETMCTYLADDLTIARSQINIKATTTEKMGFTGRKEGIAAHAVVLLISNNAYPG
ncbi:MAG: 2-C-methyl-D-erythritol 2,4-cyclodiphosphate synthase [gamma proteobacterium symbiont of Bathyaustriella thionipta]|nr:2-C-methyl-D-erythritol 2,4-cyclodiphosphate synthase [gamma proteobacterium symbiont of Bathyaustriella thionipta]MCU7949608.1 2-C-methyl-D-erythritol 2,4-cyclodiphosphate synthase [gamma proteobacterium symbiont of Bathyaustriella thionipta]MCU7953318.1 2-C-methyl-D-erythritol 2,4-cyclodiphosphate synthase [gamma proteobacterium symbiont of Bathyaustriella thionipta]MCU7956200.1 2-C-methyl-D-erythritol 2,4-cyclodiphosphate synthase [gamma proteobacterium symbiont of Bathyaustriella thionipt